MSPPGSEGSSAGRPCPIYRPRRPGRGYSRPGSLRRTDRRTSPRAWRSVRCRCGPGREGRGRRAGRPRRGRSAGRHIACPAGYTGDGSETPGISAGSNVRTRAPRSLILPATRRCSGPSSPPSGVLRLGMRMSSQSSCEVSFFVAVIESHHVIHALTSPYTGNGRSRQGCQGFLMTSFRAIWPPKRSYDGASPRPVPQAGGRMGMAPRSPP